MIFAVKIKLPKCTFYRVQKTWLSFSALICLSTATKVKGAWDMFNSLGTKKESKHQFQINLQEMLKCRIQNNSRFALLHVLDLLTTLAMLGRLESQFQEEDKKNVGFRLRSCDDLQYDQNSRHPGPTTCFRCVNQRGPKGFPVWTGNHEHVVHGGEYLDHERCHDTRQLL